ncbi:MAG: glutamate--tRNA ligase [Nitrosopumilaceae archaeon]|uniref:Glutamate--tRNA ligase n=2 Tax=Candidatus Nitrosomaritimum aestuariumsis TaxID=3342354 RepID=A0AC60VY88_9ARCH|nr:glutamate--tRNA ligase [Nitrosopumilaceae archaeon]MBA4460217.1 glutamate--tRNA ligase [Nitrosopumilaceae archaeon]MBA4461721.1 glutamate--tRNA ligase [Nitrosopumilaceae archaeon]MBA4462679.1 glutamate--tRNA ligase [Nitrosopumilaceae archaeon]NCF21368.1 glutamate--tRNA ligase [Nitrosopumilaceae archaeon]
MNDDIKSEIRKVALQNAFEHEGKTQDKIVLSKILGTKPEFRSKVKEIIGDISEIVSSVNQLSLEDQKKEIEENFPDLLKPKEKIEEREGLPPLQGAEQGKVVTRFPPEPNGYPHIGHAKAAIINAEYAKMYGGKCILRMDDTNPEAERMEYHAAIKVGLDWLGIEFDVVKSTSDDMEFFYEKGMELINAGKAYVCTCKRENISQNRKERKACKCSLGDINKNNQGWDKMFQKYKPGEAIVRFRGDMKADNAVMRDPVLFRIIDEKHYTLGEKYRVWPSYDFAVAIEDSKDGITHAFRSKEFELRKELINAILDELGMRKPYQDFFSRLEFKGMPISKRILKPLIEEGKVSWYDDPRLPTLEALRRRGIKAEAIKKFILSLGLTKANTLAPFDALESFNRKFVDADSIRLFMVNKPKKLKINKLPFSSIEVPNHPINDMGKRTIEIDGNVLIGSDDAQNLKPGIQVRLLGLGNIAITKVNEEFEGDFVEDGETSNIQKIQWIPQKTAHEIKLLVPNQLFIDEEFNENSLEELEVYTEPHYLKLKEGEEIQFVRFGYCRKDSQNQAIFTHK